MGSTVFHTNTPVFREDAWTLPAITATVDEAIEVVCFSWQRVEHLSAVESACSLHSDICRRITAFVLKRLLESLRTPPPPHPHRRRPHPPPPWRVVTCSDGAAMKSTERPVIQSAQLESDEIDVVCSLDSGWVGRAPVTAHLTSRRKRLSRLLECYDMTVTVIGVLWYDCNRYWSAMIWLQQLLKCNDMTATVIGVLWYACNSYWSAMIWL